MDLDSFLVSLYVLVDDWWRERHPPSSCPTSPAVRPCSPTRRSSPWPSSLSGPASAARGTSGASLLGPPAPLLPHVVLPGPAQSAHPSPAAGVARLAASLRSRARQAFGRLSRDGHDSRSGHREGEGFSQGALLRSGYLREERLQNRVGLRLQGGFGCGSRGRNHRFRAGWGGFGREAHRGRPHSFRPLRRLPGRQEELLLAQVRCYALLERPIRRFDHVKGSSYG